MLTSFTGLSLVAETLRALGLSQCIERNRHPKKHQRGLSDAQIVQSLQMLRAAGGDSVADVARRQTDPGLPELLGHQISSLETPLIFLKTFHYETKVSEAKQRIGPGQLAFLIKETAPLEGLAQVNTELSRVLCSHMAYMKQVVPRTEMVEQDATII